MSVDFYRNLHRNAYSLRVDGIVEGYPTSATIVQARFAVQPAGNRKVRETGRKNVHAFIRTDDVDNVGLIEPLPPTGSKNGSFRIFYNPYNNTSFVDNRGMTVAGAEKVWLFPDYSIWAVGLRR